MDIYTKPVYGNSLSIQNQTIAPNSLMVINYIYPNPCIRAEQFMVILYLSKSMDIYTEQFRGIISILYTHAKHFFPHKADVLGQKSNLNIFPYHGKPSLFFPDNFIHFRPNLIGGFFHTGMYLRPKLAFFFTQKAYI